MHRTAEGQDLRLTRLEQSTGQHGAAQPISPRSFFPVPRGRMLQYQTVAAPESISCRL